MIVSQYPSRRHGRSAPSFAGHSAARARAYLMLLATAIRSGKCTSFAIRGGCMWPTIRAGDRIRIAPLLREPRVGDVLVCYRDTYVVAHRVVQHFHDTHGRSWVRCRGDASVELDAPLRTTEVMGVVDAVERAGRILPPRAAAALSSRLIAPLRAAFAWLSARAR